MNLNELFIGKSTRKERKERRRRELERLQSKAELARLNQMFKDRKTKIQMMKRVENTKSFQSDLMKMKQVLKDPEYFKPRTNMQVKGFDKTFKKKKDFMLL